MRYWERFASLELRAVTQLLGLAASLALAETSSSCIPGDDAWPEEPLSTVHAAAMPLGGSTPVCVTIQRGASGDVADALITQLGDVPGSNYGVPGSLATGGVYADQRQALIRFDVSSIPPGATITSATATLSVLLGGGAPTRAHRITAPWAEDAVTWASFNGAFAAPVAAVFPAGAPTSSDLTSLAQGWVSGSIVNNGILLERDLPGMTAFGSSESPQAQRPRLDVCYLPSACAGQADGSPCDDGDPCTQVDQCSSGLCLGSSAVTCAGSDRCPCAAPHLYSNAMYESPVRGDPGDVLLLPGTGFTAGASTSSTVVYQALSDTTRAPAQPASIPSSQTATMGVIVPLAVDAYTVTIVLPMAMRAGQSYALWVVTQDPGGNTLLWSNPIMINDARPMWLSPGPHGQLSPTAQTSYPYVYTAAGRPGIGRTLKIVGRNLEHAPGRQTRVRLTAPPGANLPLLPLLTAADDGDPTTQIERYAAKVTLPAIMPLAKGQATDYDVAVSRDGVSWVPLPTKLTALPDPPAVTAANSFYPSSYRDEASHCDPCDSLGEPGSDDTLCIARAIRAAKQYSDGQTPANNTDPAGLVPGNVVFSAPTCPSGKPAVWIVAANCNPGDQGFLEDSYPALGGEYTACVRWWGLPVPRGVNLIAEPGGHNQPTIETEEGFDKPHLDAFAASGSCSALPDETSCTTARDCCSSGAAQGCVTVPGDPSQNRCELLPPDFRQHLFVLAGHNRVQGLRFHDNYKATFHNLASTDGPIAPLNSPGASALMISGDDATIIDNFFDDNYIGIHVWPHTLPDQQQGNMGFVITGNKFGSWLESSHLGLIEDSVVANNTFWPGASLAVVGLETVGSQRLDISSNELDGNNSIVKPDGTRPSYSAPFMGWRAGMFFSNFTSHANVLVAGNHISCVGTRPDQDGEAIATDSNGDVAGFRSNEVVRSVSPSGTQVTVDWPGSQNLGANRAPDAYEGRWLRVEYGPGLGQARKIVDVSNASAPATTITFTVSPPFDVLPVAGQSRVQIGNQVWRMYIVDNRVDNTDEEACPAAFGSLARLHPAGAGVIALYGSSVDVAIESNQQLNTAGIGTFAAHEDQKTTIAGVDSYSAYYTDQYFVDVRGNRITSKLGGSTNSNNQFGSGVNLISISGTLDNGAILANYAYPGFGVSISHNTITDTAVTRLGSFADQQAGISIGPVQIADQSSSPGYVGTLVFANSITGTDRSAALTSANAAAIGNGTFGTSPGLGMPNYPQGTVICGNEYHKFPALYSDWPGAGETSTLVLCGADSGSQGTLGAFFSFAGVDRP